MKNLSDILLASERRQDLIEAAVQVIEAHVSTRSGIKGMTLKTGLAMIKKARPGILPRAVGRLLPDFAAAFDPLYREFATNGGGDFSQYVVRHSSRASDALLEVADLRVQQASHTVRGAYARFRGNARSEVSEAMPAIAALLQQFVRQ